MGLFPWRVKRKLLELIFDQEIVYHLRSLATNSQITESHAAEEQGKETPFLPPPFPPPTLQLMTYLEGSGESNNAFPENWDALPLPSHFPSLF